MITIYVDTEIPHERNVHAQFVLMKLKMNTTFLFNAREKVSRQEFYQKITPIKENFVTMNNSGKVQFLFTLTEAEKGTMCEFSKFVCQSFKVRVNHT